jgi:signal transduction histidine kinase
VEWVTQDRAEPSGYQPALTRWSHVWRLVVALGISAVVWISVVEGQGELLFVLDIALGVVAFCLTFLRRRWPMTVALLTSVMATFSASANGPSVLAAISVATRRRWTEIIPLSLFSLVCAQFFPLVHSVEGEPPLLTFALNLFAIVAAMAWGMYIGSRRELLWSLRQRAERAEAEQELRAAQSRSNERERIAREMHDVLAHRISQISMHAGALAFREDLTADEMRDSAGVIQAKAHEALTDLRGVLGVLRDGSGELTHAPLPTYADVPGLVEEARESGMTVSLEDRLDPVEPVPDAAGRTIYRIVQEGLTNANKHAPGSTLTIELSGSPEDGIDVVLRNPLGFGSRTPGSGLGLVGLTERAELRGGRLEHGLDGSAFVLRGWIPWAA